MWRAETMAHYGAYWAKLGAVATAPCAATRPQAFRLDCLGGPGHCHGNPGQRARLLHRVLAADRRPTGTATAPRTVAHIYNGTTVTNPLKDSTHAAAISKCSDRHSRRAAGHHRGHSRATEHSLPEPGRTFLAFLDHRARNSPNPDGGRGNHVLPGPPGRRSLGRSGGWPDHIHSGTRRGVVGMGRPSEPGGAPRAGKCAAPRRGEGRHGFSGRGRARSVRPDRGGLHRWRGGRHGGPWRQRTGRSGWRVC